jgi:WD40 repeat protein
VRLWDAQSGKVLGKYPGHGTTVNGVAFFPDDKRMAATSFDGTASVWRAPR